MSSKKKKTEEVSQDISSAPKGVKMYKVGVNIFENKYYAEKFAARKGLVIEEINQ